MATSEVVSWLSAQRTRAYDDHRDDDYRMFTAALDEIFHLDALCVAKSDALLRAATLTRCAQEERDRARDLAARLEEELAR